MSQEETQGSEPVSTQQPAADTGTPEVRTPAPRIAEAKLESAHAELPPMSVIGATAEPAAKPGTIATPKQFGRRGTPRGVSSTAPGQSARPSMGVVEDPSQLTESISGSLANQPAQPPRERRDPRPEGSDYGDRPRREPRENREPRQEGISSEGARQQGIPQGDRPRREPREPRPEGAGYGDRPRREPREPRPEGAGYGDRPRREPREPRPEGAGFSERPRREDRPRIQIEPVVIPVQAPIGFWASLKRKLATLFGIPTKAVFVPSERPSQSRGEHRGGHSDRGQRGGRGHGGRGHGEHRGEHRGERRGDSRGGRGRGDFRGDRGPRNGPREG